MAARSYLFVPGDRPDRFEKAWNAGADVVIIDLEDAVSVEDKLAAREATAVWLSPERSVYVRVNGACRGHAPEGRGPRAGEPGCVPARRRYARDPDAGVGPGCLERSHLGRGPGRRAVDV